jgi:hypothetical protein
MHSVVVPYQALDEIISGLIWAGKDAAKARGELEH